MPKKIGFADENYIRSAAVPAATSSYTPIAHGLVIDTIVEELTLAGFNPVESRFRAGINAQVVSGVVLTDYKKDPDLQLVIAFSNSYDKSRKFTAAVGVGINSNHSVAIGAEMGKFIRKHTGTANTEMVDIIQKHIQKAKEYYDALLVSKAAMLNIEVDISTVGSVLGNLFIHDYLTSDQMGIVKREYEQPSFAYSTPKTSLWNFYNHILYSLQTSHPSKWLTQQLAVSLYFQSVFKLDSTGSAEEPDLEKTDDEVVVFPGYEAMNKDRLKQQEDNNEDSELQEDSDIQNHHEIDDDDVYVEEPTEAVNAEEHEELEQPEEIVDDLENDPEDVPGSLDQQPQQPQETQEEVKVSKPETLEEITVSNIVKESVTKPFYISRDEHPSLKSGGKVSFLGIDYEVSGEELIGDISYWKLLALVPNTEPASEVEPETSEIKAETEVEIEVEADEPDEPADFVDSNLDSVEKTDEFDISETDQQILLEMRVDEEVEREKTQKIRAAIYKELVEIYGEVDDDFTFILKDDIYTVKLNTSESITLSRSLIDTASNM